jgi:hypothetical protein
MYSVVICTKNARESLSFYFLKAKRYKREMFSLHVSHYNKLTIGDKLSLIMFVYRM